MTDRGVRGNWASDYLQAESDDDDGWYGYDRGTSHDPGTEPIPVADLHDRLEAEQCAGEAPITNGYVLPSEDDALPEDAPAAIVETPPDVGRDRVVDDPPPIRPRPIGSDFADSFRTLTFKVPTTPWYRSKKVVIAAAAIAAVAAVAVLIIRMPGGSTDETTVVRDATTSAAPSPTSAQPTLTPMASTPPAPPPPPLPPPPPPPPPAEPASPPVYSGGSQWEPSAPSSQKPPQIDVTRAPISVAPPPRPAPGHNSATPGDGRRGGGGWGW